MEQANVTLFSSNVTSAVVGSIMVGNDNSSLDPGSVRLGEPALPPVVSISVGQAFSLVEKFLHR